MIVAGHHDLPAHRLDGVEGVEEFLLRRLLPAEEMHVVDHEQIQIAHLPAERIELVGPKRGEEFVGEFLAGQIRPPLGRMQLDKSAAEALEQVRLAQAAVAVDEQRVVLRAGEFGDVAGGVVGELIAGAHDEASRWNAAAAAGSSALGSPPLPPRSGQGGRSEPIAKPQRRCVLPRGFVRPAVCAVLFRLALGRIDLEQFRDDLKAHLERAPQHFVGRFLNGPGKVFPDPFADEIIWDGDVEAVLPEIQPG